MIHLTRKQFCIHHVLFVLIIWLICPANKVSAQTTLPDFKHFTTYNGLSNHVVGCSFQDFRGFLWFGTADGLNKYDGYSFEIFRNKPGDPHSLPDNSVRDVLEDSHKNLWIATMSGLSRFNAEVNNFSSFRDILMPEMDGLEATKWIRKNNPVQPIIIAMTANALLKDREECITAGMNDYISKPIDLETLKRILKESWMRLGS